MFHGYDIINVIPRILTYAYNYAFIKQPSLLEVKQYIPQRELEEIWWWP